jgi:death-on-curing protein
MQFLNSVMMRAIHGDLIQGYGGRYGLRDLGLLESALARPLQPARDEPEAGVERLAAALGWGLLKNRAFLDGNKRVVLAGVITFLKLNGYKLTCSDAEETAMVLRAAEREIDEAEWTAWVERSVGRV